MTTASTITDEEIEKIEIAVYNAQTKWILDHYGLEASANANYGWSSEVNEDSIEVCTKIYGIGVVISEAKLSGEPNISFKFEQFEE